MPNLVASHVLLSSGCPRRATRIRHWAAVAVLAMAGWVASAGPAAAQTESVLVNFTGTSGAASGENPEYGNLIQGSDGNFYGTTYEGGAGGGGYGYGTVFKVSSAGTYTLLHSFSFATDGGLPYAGLVEGTDGNFYGTTYGGGANYYGTVFKISSTGTFTLLHSFAGTTDGVNPYGGLVQGTDGNFYGTTSGGGASDAGTVFKISSTGTFTLLRSFSGTTSDGSGPSGTLVQGTDGNFYGTTSGGSGGRGTVYSISSTGTFTLLYSFSTASTGTGVPQSGLAQGTDGNFYGTTEIGGANGYGSIFKITPTGTLTLLHSFANTTTDGYEPFAGLVQGTDGNFYGTTHLGGAYGNGAVFSITSTGRSNFFIHFYSTQRPMAVSPTPAWYRPATATSMARHTLAGRTTMGRCSSWFHRQFFRRP